MKPINLQELQEALEEGKSIQVDMGVSEYRLRCIDYIYVVAVDTRYGWGDATTFPNLESAVVHLLLTVGMLV